MESINDLCDDVDKMRVNKNMNLIFLPASNKLLDKTQTAMKKFVSEIECEKYKSDLFSVVIQPFIIGQTWMLNVWDFQLRKSRCIVFDMSDDQDDFDDMKVILKHRWVSFMKLNIKMVGKCQYVEEKSPWSHKVVRVTFKNKRDKNSRSHSLMRMMIVMYDTAYHGHSIDEIVRVAKGQLNDERNISRMVRVTQAALITKSQGQSRVSIGDHLPPLKAQIVDSDKHDDNKENQGQGQGHDVIDKNEEVKDDNGKGKAGEGEGEDQSQDDSESEGNVDDDEAEKDKMILPDKKKHFAGRPKQSNSTPSKSKSSAGASKSKNSHQKVTVKMNTNN